MPRGEGDPPTPPFQPRREALPDEVPVFPLPGALLLPGGRMPLNIFEQRYLALIDDALGHGRLFGMIGADATAEPAPTGPRLPRVGCLGRISSFAETDDGRYLVTLSGVVRFAVAEELSTRRGYRRVRPDYAPFLTDLTPVSVLPLDRDALIAALRPYFRARGIEADWEVVEGTPDATLVTTLCMVCPFDAREKQALLEAPDPAARADMLITLMRMGAHGDGPSESRPS